MSSYFVAVSPLKLKDDEKSHRIFLFLMKLSKHSHLMPEKFIDETVSHFQLPNICNRSLFIF